MIREVGINQTHLLRYIDTSIHKVRRQRIHGRVQVHEEIPTTNGRNKTRSSQKSENKRIGQRQTEA